MAANYLFSFTSNLNTSGMSDDTKTPILNNPYEEPLFHYDTDLSGNLDYNKVLPGRRPYDPNIGITPSANPQGEIFGGADLYNSDEDNAKFINGLRDEVKRWRQQGYPHTTRVTRELLNFWFCNPERPYSMMLFFCQREAVETAVYLNEVAERDPNLGRNFLRQLDERRQSVSNDYNYVLPRTAFKMATGTGKTVVMAMLILYHYLNKKEYHQDTRFADHFLLVAPGITIRDRLGVLYIDESGKNEWDKSDYYHQRGLIPQNYERLLEGINACITITNYHQFEPKVYSGKKASPMDGKLVFDGEKMVKQSDKEDFSIVLGRVLGRQMKGKRIVVINDEAHHCYLPKDSEEKRKKDEEMQETEEENKHAMVWYEGLRQMKLLGYKLQNVYDLSATPYYLKGSGYPEYSLFPWVVSDFGLVDAIESGLVKIPFLPSYDNTHDLDEPKLRNIYQHIKSQLPKKGQRGQKKADKEEGKEKAIVEDAPHLPVLLNTALKQFVEDYEKYEQNMREGAEAGADLFSTPPVLIIVCNNTTVSKEVYKYIAGYKREEDADGNPVYVSGNFPIFSNYKDNLPLSKAPTLLIDSTQIDQAADVIDADFKSVFADEIKNFKREYAIQHGAGSADQLTDSDILREVVNTVGKPNTLGSHVRCVVSVSMLTEGWDANTVTHVCGIRAFGSQLLCEQVAGRALRRRNYDLRRYDAATGEELPEDSRRTKGTVLKFPPEYARIIGVPFKTFKSGTTAKPQPPQPKTIIKALPERKAMEIRFPNLRGYRIENIDGRITADFTGVPKFRMDFAKEVPYETFLQNAVQKGTIQMTTDPDEWRDAEIIYYLTQQLISEKYSDREGGRQFQKFCQLKRIVEYWYDHQIEVIGGTGDVNMRRLVRLWDGKQVIDNIYEGIKKGIIGEDRQNITAILDYYNPTGSTSHVWAKTAKKVYPTAKSHVNYVVADTDTWEQICAKELEQNAAVKHYVKNYALGFKIPYMVGGEEHNYVTDFIAVVTAPDGREVKFIIEISGFSDERTGHKDAKRHYTKDYWIPAVNNLKDYGEWDFIEITDIDNIHALLTQKINSL